MVGESAQIFEKQRVLAFHGEKLRWPFQNIVTIFINGPILL